jgi:hypothetical protein
MSTDTGVILSFCSPVFWQFRKVISLWIFFFFSCTGILFARSEADIAFEIDVYAIKASGIAKWFEEKYPDLRNWAEEVGQGLLVDAGIDESTGLVDNNLTDFALFIRSQSESMGPLRKERGAHSDHQVFCYFYLGNQLHLPNISKWLFRSISLNLGPQKTEEILSSILLTENNFLFNLSTLIALFPQMEPPIYPGLDSSLSVKIINETNGSQVLAVLSGSGEFDSFRWYSQFDKESSSFPTLLTEHQISFYADISESSLSQFLSAYYCPSTILENFDGLKSVAWGACLLDRSISIEFVLAFKDQESARRAFVFCENSSNVLRLVLTKDGARHAACFLIKHLHTRHWDHLITAKLEIKSTDLELLIPWLLSTFTSRVP